MPVIAWFEASQLRYMIIAQALLCAFALAVVVGALLPRAARFLATPRGIAVFLALAFLALLGSRWPTLFVLYGMNVDESQMVAQSISVPSNPWPWYGFDGLTSGPLNTYVLCVLEALGLPGAFITARIAALLLEFGGVAALYAVLSGTFSAAVARVSVFAPIVFWAVTRSDDFVHYSSEQLALFLVPATYALLVWSRRYDYRASLLFACGLCLGALPFAKMQSAPIVIVSAVIVAACVLGATPLSLRSRVQRLAVFVLGSLTVPMLFFAAMIYAGSLGDFWIGVQSSLAYIVEQTHLFAFLTTTPDFGSYFLTLSTCSILGVLCVVFAWPRFSAAERNTFAIALLVLGASIYAIYRPGRDSPHYLLFAVLPAAAAGAIGLSFFSRVLEIPATGRRTALLAGTFVIAIAIVQNAIARAPYNWLGRDFDVYMWPGAIDDVAGKLDAFMRPNERMAIWGWRPQYFVYSHLRLGTRDAVPEYQHEVIRNPNRAYFQQRYLADFKRLNPEGFLDAGPDSFDFSGGNRYGHEEFPALAAIIAAGYVEKFEVRRYRFYIRRDLATRKIAS